MEEANRPPQRERPVRQPVLLGLFAGAGVAAGYLLAGVPGVELMTLIACLAGVALGPVSGAAAGALAEAVYSLGSPYGPPAPPLLIGQVAGMAASGLLGGVAGPALVRLGRSRRGAVAAAAVGVLAALVFDLLSNVGIILGYAMDWRVVLVGGLGMGAVHLAVNGVVFATVLPAAAARAALAGRGALRGGPAAALLVLLMAAAPGARAQEAAPADTVRAVAADSTAAAAVDSAGARPARRVAAPEGPAALGWERELWTPFATHALTWLDWNSPRTTVVEAGVGGPAFVLGEACTSPTPQVTVDGVPWGTGHALADDPWLMPQQGLAFADDSWFADGMGGTGGGLALATDDPDPARSVSRYRGVKGRHESYMRGIDLLTSAAPWRVAFAFEEILDNEAWNYSDLPDEIFAPDPLAFPGHGKARQSRTRLTRTLDPDNSLALEFTTGRRTRNNVPAWNADQAETWDTGVSAVMNGAAGAVRWRAAGWWRDRDVQWSQLDDRGGIFDARKVETGREGVRLEVAPRGDDAGPRPLTKVVLDYHHWSVADASDSLRTRPEGLESRGGRGRRARLEAGTGWRLGRSRLAVMAAGTWDERIDIAPGWSASLSEDAERPWWRLELAGDGRAPRSDELLTASERYIGNRELTLLPNRGLGREHTLRAGLLLQGRLLGTGLALDASWRRLEDGIMWEALPGEVTVGRWRNGLAMTSVRVTGRIERAGRFLGWGRALVEATWQQADETAGQAPFLPPEVSGRAALMWENHFFREDGILQLGLVGWRRGEMDDPWDVTRTYRLPARTQLDLLVGFRLVGAHLSLAFKNLTGERTQLSAGTWSSGQEMDMRLSWTFRH